MSKKFNERQGVEQDFRDLLPGFCKEIPDLSVRVWRFGMAKTISMHYGQCEALTDTIILRIFRTDGHHFALAVPKLVICAFSGVSLERIKSVDYVDEDCVNCSLHNLRAVYAGEPTNEAEVAMLHRAARDEGLELAREPEYSFGNPFGKYKNRFL